MDNPRTTHYTEDAHVGNPYREKQLNQLQEFISEQRAMANQTRANYFKPNMSSVATYCDSIEQYRQDYLAMLGFPLAPRVPELALDAVTVPNADISYVGEDDLGTIYRLEIAVLGSLTTYGVLFIPHGTGPFPLVISQHGGGGTPELCSGFVGPSNYHQMSRKVLAAGFAVFAPQLLLWDKQRFGPDFNRHQIDVQLKQLGGSITALEIVKIQRSLDYLISRDDIDGSRIGMIGLSYGGFYTLYCAAAEPRIKVAVSSCFFNDRFVYDWSDWTWFNAAHRFLDPEVCALICPRPLYIEIGKEDALFTAELARSGLEQVKSYYQALGLSAQFVSTEFPGGHELDTSGANIEFLRKYL